MLRGHKKICLEDIKHMLRGHKNLLRGHTKI